MDVIIVCHTEFGIVRHQRVIADKGGVDGVKVGARRLAELADKHGAKITFAVMPEVVQDFPRDVRHEVGLHIHPGWQEFKIQDVLFYVGDRYLREHCRQSSDSTFLKDYPYEEQLGMIREGKKYVEQAFGKEVKVFVAGRWSLNQDTIRALVQTGMTHDCSARAHAKSEGFDWSRLPRISLPYHPSKDDYQAKGDLPITIVPISQFFPHGNVNPEMAVDIGLSWLKACFVEYYRQNLPLFHICSHSPAFLDSFIVSVMDDLLSFIARHANVRFIFASQVQEYATKKFATNLFPYMVRTNGRILKTLGKKAVRCDMQSFFLRIIATLYRKVFREEISSEGRSFLSNLGYVAVGFGFSTIFLFVFQIVIGRVLGPVEYGKYALVQSVAMFLSIPMTMGLHTALVKYNAGQKDFKTRQSIISTAYLLVSGASLFFFLMFLFLVGPLAPVFQISSVLFSFAVIFALFYALHFLSTGMLQSIHELKKLSFMQTLYSLTPLSLFLAFVLFGRWPASFQIALAAALIGYALYFLFVSYNLRRYISFRVNTFWIKKLLWYGLYGVLAGVSVALSVHLGQILINAFLSVKEVGVYRAYYTSFVILASSLFRIFNVAFFPSASKLETPEVISRKIGLLTPYLTFLGGPLLMGIGLVLFQFYGAEYSFDVWLGIFFALAGLLIVLDGLYGWLMAAAGKEGVRITAFAALVVGVTGAFFNFLLIPVYGLYGAVFATIVSYGFSLIFLLSRRSHVWREVEKEKVR